MGDLKHLAVLRWATLILCGFALASPAAGCGGPTATRSTLSSATAATSVPTASTLQPSLPLNGKVIVVDPGHDGGDVNHPEIVNRLVDIGTKMKACETTGTATSSGYAEAAFNFDVALRLRKLLRARGAKVVMTRDTNAGVGPCINRRAAIGNQAHGDAAVSIHADGGPASGRGFHVIMPKSVKGLTDDIAVSSRRLGLSIRSSYAHGTGMPYATYLGDGVGITVRDDLGGLNLSDIPKVFIETGNMRSSVDALLLESPSFRQRIAAGLEGGIERFLAPQKGDKGQ